MSISPTAAVRPSSRREDAWARLRPSTLLCCAVRPAVAVAPAVCTRRVRQGRVAALWLGMGEAMSAFTVQINCGFGVQSIDTGYRFIQEGVSDLILAGGAESLSHAPVHLDSTA